MLPSLWRAVRPALSLRASTGLPRAGHNPAAMPSPPPPHCLPAMFVQRCNMGTLNSMSVQRSNMGTHPMKEIESLNSPQGAKDFIYSLQAAERTCLLRELHKFESVLIAQGQLEIAPPTQDQLRYVLLHNAIPFVGFGFLDNAIMIVAGTQIELSIGVILGISTMAAAALGNLVSDLAGLGLAGYVEALAYRLGMRIPDLSPKQADMWQTRLSAHSGKAIGVVIGCILGMFPLFFFKDDKEKKKGAEEGKEQTQTPAMTTSSKN